MVEAGEISGINWKLITKGLPQPNRFAKDRGYSLQEIRKLCEYPDLRIKPIIYVMATSGIRLGAWDNLKWDDVIPHSRNGKHVCSILKVYDESDGEYPALITKEAHDELEKWMNYRKEHGEVITNDSWLMIQLWDTKDGRLENPLKLLAEGGVKKLVESALYRTGLRTPLKNGKKRHDVAMNHGFRKFCETALRRVREPEITNEDIQILTGHANEGMIDHYYRPSMDANNILDGHLIDEYLRAAKYLIIDEKNNEIYDIKTDVRGELESKFNAMENRFAKLEYNSWINDYEKDKIQQSKEEVEKEIMHLRQTEPDMFYWYIQDKDFVINIEEQIKAFKQYYIKLYEKELTDEQIKSLYIKPRNIKVYHVKIKAKMEDVKYEDVDKNDIPAMIKMLMKHTINKEYMYVYIMCINMCCILYITQTAPPQ